MLAITVAPAGGAGTLPLLPDPEVVVVPEDVEEDDDPEELDDPGDEDDPEEVEELGDPEATAGVVVLVEAVMAFDPPHPVMAKVATANAPRA